MSERHPATDASRKPKPGPSITMRAIRRYARQIVERFQPEKIILFGSYAYGEPNEDSDVDLLVVMPARNQIDQAVKIRWELEAPFPVDLIVRTPTKLKRRLKYGDVFHTYITANGILLYEAVNAGVATKGRRRPRDGQKARAGKTAVA